MHLQQVTWLEGQSHMLAQGLGQLGPEYFTATSRNNKNGSGMLVFGHCRTPGSHTAPVRFVFLFFFFIFFLYFVEALLCIFMLTDFFFFFFFFFFLAGTWYDCTVSNIVS